MASTSISSLPLFARLWSALFVILFPVLGLLGVFMRLFQSEMLPDIEPSWFYAAMTLHGLGLVGLVYATSFALLITRLSQYVAFRPSMLYVSTGLTGIGVILLVVLFLVRFGPGWYFLYPLPFKSAGVWPEWAPHVFLVALTVLGVAWLLWKLETLRAMAKSFKFSTMLGWHVLAGKAEPSVPPAVLVATICCIAGIIALSAAVVMLVFFYYTLLTGNAADALLVKNLTFFFGHVLINLAMYQGIGVLYDVFPTYTRHQWPMTKPMAIAWNLVLLLVLFAYFHHLYMDFAQPVAVQIIGQAASYGTAIPAAVVTILGTLAHVYRRRVEWNWSSLLLFFGTMGWAVGGTAAVIDSTVAANFRFHNTLWVPAHFHTYLLAGIVLIILGGIAHFVSRAREYTLRPARLPISLLLIGAYGFVTMFYIGGLTSVPRRYAIYPIEVAHGSTLAQVALVFVALIMVGVAVYLWDVGRLLFLPSKRSS
ncbi:MAG: cbb3-type cytochrome c oxidase subunit I [Bacteroidota bacterium]|nr:cbb3-type cytochrome c oxidase subunit I [Candidatus Kapabacteria bacterium]MDW8075071.1 cbb3-type cytochrome c oxidase subunit I [Bacteroidota bacterium]